MRTRFARATLLAAPMRHQVPTRDLARLWRDARGERIWDGTSEIQRHIISRDVLRPLGA